VIAALQYSARAIAGARQHLRISASLARVGVVRKSQFKFEFWSQVIMDCFWYGAHVGVFEVLYSHSPEIAGWNREAFRVLLGYLFVSDAFMMIFLAQMWRFGRDLKDGKLDPYRVRPASALFLYAFNQFSLEGCLNMLVASGYLVYALVIAVPQIGAGTVLVALAAVALSFWVRFVLVTLFSLLELVAVGADGSRFLQDLLYASNDRPLDIFERRLRLFLIYVVPVGGLAHVPAAIVLGRYSWLEALFAVGWLFALGLLVFAAWTRGFRRYESAMG
jgi:ABC-2 type transport system permease protein